MSDQEYIAYLEAKCQRFLDAFPRVLPSHHQHNLFFHYTVDRPAVRRKFEEWIGSDKNPVKPYDPERWFSVFGLEPGDVVKDEKS